MDPEESLQSTVAQDDAAFEQDWGSALNGELASPTGQSGEDEQSAATQPVVPPGQDGRQPAAAQQAAPEVPDFLLQRAREAGFGSLDDALKAARNFQSIRGQLPNLEEAWKKQHLAPLERELAAVRERDRQAREQFIRFDPATDYPRSREEQARIAQALQAEEAQQRAELDNQAQREQAQLAEQARQAEFAQREASVKEMERGNLKLLALNSLQPFVQSLAASYGIPQAEIQRYIDETGMVQRVQALDDMRRYGPMIDALEDHVRVRAGQLQAENARQANASGRYRDIGGAGGGSGGQSGADRWAKANDQDFERAWQRALDGELAVRG